ncbi:MAG: tetratricopeptide repeat protein [Ferruginibacter sp.]
MHPIRKKVCIAILLVLPFSFFHATAQTNNPLINSGEVIQEGTKLHDDKKYKEAIEEYQKVDRSDTNYINALYELSYSCYSDSQFAKSIEYAKLGMKLFPQKYAAYSMQAANSLDDLNKNEEALQLYDEGLKKNPQSSLLYFNKGVVNFKLKKYDEAKKYMQQCLLINPYYSSAHYFLGKVYQLQGNLVAALLAFKTYLLIAPSGRYFSNIITSMSSIAKVNDEVLDLVKNAPKTKEDNFSEQQEILLSKLALEKQYKLKADLEDNIVRQIQVVDEKLEYNKNDKGFCMQYYVPFYVKIMNDGDFEAMIFSMFSGINNKDIENWNKKNKKEKDAFIERASAYLYKIKKTQILDVAQREQTDINYIYNGQYVVGKGKYSKDKEPLTIGSWDYYYNDGAIKATGNYNDAGKKEGLWTYYHINGEVKEKTFMKNGLVDGLSEGWFDNGIKSYTETYVQDKLNGIQTFYFYNGNLKSVVPFKDDLKNGEERFYNFKGVLTSTSNFVNDKLEGITKAYFPNGKIKNEFMYKNDKAEGLYKSYFKSGSLYITGEFKEGEKQGLWTTYYEDGVISEKTTYLDNEITGEFTEYHPNGKLSAKGTYYKKKIDGKYEKYDDDGKLYEDNLYDRGKLKEINFYDKEGKVISTTTTRKGAANIVFYTAEGIKSSEGYFNKDGLKEGKFTSYFSTGKINEESNWKAGLREGPGTTYYASGKIKEITNYKNDVEDGYVKSFYSNGKISGEGWKVEGDRQQKFLYYSPVGDLTSTEYYLNNDLGGFTEFYHPGHKINMETFYSNGWVQTITQFDSTGKAVSVNDFIKGKGPLIYKNENGKNSVVASYDHYLLNGAFTYYFFDGSISASSFYKNDELDSVYKSYYYGGKLRFEGNYKDGEKKGTWKYYYPNGKEEREENYVDGELDGIYKMYQSDGSVEKILTYKNGDLVTSNIYGEKNELAAKFNYKDGILKSYQYEEKPGTLCAPIVLKSATGKLAAKYPNGQPSITFEIIDNNIEGERKIFYSNGKLCSVNTRLSGNIDGPVKLYYSNGNIWEEKNYVSGILHGSCKYYYPNGKLEREENYYNDDKHGECKFYDEQGKLKQTFVYYYGSLLSVK